MTTQPQTVTEWLNETRATAGPATAVSGTEPASPMPVTRLVTSAPPGQAVGPPQKKVVSEPAQLHDGLKLLATVVWGLKAIWLALAATTLIAFTVMADTVDEPVDVLPTNALWVMLCVATVLVAVGMCLAALHIVFALREQALPLTIVALIGVVIDALAIAFTLTLLTPRFDSVAVLSIIAGSQLAIAGWSLTTHFGQRPTRTS